MERTICKLGIISCLITALSSHPLNCSENRPLLYGIPVEEGLDNNPEYPQPEYILPLIIEGSTPEPGPAVVEPGACIRAQHSGYAAVSALESRLMPLDDFMEKHCLPDNVCFKVMKNAKPVLDLKSCDNSIKPLSL